ncbi:MAG: hypothetical protein UW26_C0038G0002 [Candidatus Collierbacteria bacterium GW2011_GWF1_44_12]|uniref:DUF4012 domain-containing protein n=1 Tax=Candidatus Collierbacteria bacterium GW2011_GWF1_44_12 TaxID=1618402 RepID=A0A0G1GQC0_9BACT|nr:MAG: hypothetical protein UW26_C0038G0002 [Candidatus Collierbacteria bacterium GW2011_GWF1_44_12]
MKISVNKRTLKRVLIPLGIILILFLVVGAYGYFTARSFMPTINALQVTGSGLAADFQNQDLAGAKEKSRTLGSQLETLDGEYGKVMWTGAIPFLGAYTKDGKAAITASKSLAKSLDTLITSVEPYADLLGFKTSVEEATPEGAPKAPQSIEDRIVFMAATLDKISPDLDKVAVDVENAQKELDKIDASRYPETFMGKQVRGRIISLKTTVTESAQLLTQAKPLIKLLPDLLGNPTPKLYMVLFQNDAELRPTGGFITAYAFLKVTKGKIEPLGSYDIYDLDARLNKRLPAPPAIQRYLNEKNLNIRNVNVSPDFKVSMDEFVKLYQSIPNVPKPDAIVAIDTNFPVEILKIIGPIGVGGWGNFGPQIDPRCDCPQVVYALEEIADRPTNTVRVGRKAVLGPLMHSMMANAMGSPKHTWPSLVNVVLNSIKEKHLLFYFYDEVTQKTAEDFNAAGRIQGYAYDYLHINDSNFGGAKTDMFITRDVEQEIEMTSEGKVTKTVTLNYNNPHKGSNCNLEAGQLCLNGVYRDWVRLFVPKGSTLISVVGSEVKEQVSEELDKTVFEGFFTMRPESTSKIVFKYELPQLDLSTYRMLIQKQPGLPTIKHTILLNGVQTLVDLNSDKEVTLNQ